jgi:drug/metabolite transporter superfamily protein YnfA
MDEASKQMLLSAVRSILIVLGSILTTKGYADDETVQAAIGAVMVILPIAWGMVDKVLTERAAKAREVVAVNAGIIVADATKGKTPLASAETAPTIIAAAGHAAENQAKGKS